MRRLATALFFPSIGVSMPTNFTACHYGPIQIRTVLRHHLARGERLVGWGVATTEMRLHEFLLSVGMALVPLVGHGIMGAMMGETRRLVLLTDRRLLVLRVTKKALRGAEVEIGLGDLIVERSGGRNFVLRALGLPRGLKLTLSAKATDGSGRLARALVTLAEPGPNAGA